MMKRLWAYLRQRQTLSNLLVLLAAIAFYMILSRFETVRLFFAELFRVISPLVWGAVIAYLINPLVTFFETRLFSWIKHKKLARVVCTVLVLILVLAVIVLLVVMLIPQLASSAKVLLESLPGYFETLKQTLSRWSASLGFLELDVDELIGSWQGIITSISSWVENNISGILGASYRAGSSVVEFLLALVLSLYLLLDAARIKRAFRRWGRATLKPSTYDRVQSVAMRSHKIFTNFIGSNLVDALIIGVATFVFMLIMRMPYAPLISVLAGVTNLVPTFGPIIGAVPCILILFIVNPLDALWYLIFVVVIQTMDSVLIKPLLFKDSTGLRPLWVLASIIICGRLFGVMGMLLGIPVFAVLAFMAEDLIQHRLARRGLDNEGLNADSPQDVPPGEPPGPPDPPEPTAPEE